jgi:hypothetical protein
MSAPTLHWTVCSTNCCRPARILEKLVGLYGVVRPALLESYRRHAQAVNPVADYPTAYLLKHLLLDAVETAEWEKKPSLPLLQTPGAAETAEQWAQHLTRFLDAAGGIMGTSRGPQRRPPAQPPPPLIFSHDGMTGSHCAGILSIRSARFL